MTSCWNESGCMASIRDYEKYIYHFGDQPDEVFDLSEDPLEERNLADKRSKEELDRRRDELLAWRSRLDALYEERAAAAETNLE
jgi:lipoteichoic acid synthase